MAEMKNYELEIWFFRNDDLDFVYRTIRADNDQQAIETIRKEIKNPYRIIHNNKRLF